jgi:GTP-binding protein EngB required for normal cell division
MVTLLLYYLEQEQYLIIILAFKMDKLSQRETRVTSLD